MQTPTYDNFQVAPNTLPQTRFGAQEMGDPGTAITQQAKVSMALGQHYGEQALQQMMAANQSVADQKWVEVENYRLQLQQEYEQERGLNALNREGGLSLADEYNNKLNQFIADRAESLNNRAQVEMFAQRVGPTQADFSDGVTKHMMAEGRKFQEETLKGRLDVTVSGAVVAPTDRAFATAITRLEGNIGDIAAHEGWPPEKAQMELRAKVGEIVSQRANRLMDLGDHNTASSMVDQYEQMMDGKTVLDLRARISKFQLDDISAQQADQLYEAFKNDMPVDGSSVVGGGQSTVSTSEDINRAVAKIIRNESGGDSNATNKSSTAKGLGQFIDSTWLTMVKRYRPDIAAGKSNAQIIALKTNAPLAREMTTRYAEENARALRSAGMPVTDGNLYLAHFLGAGGAVKLLSAQDKSQPVVNLVGQKVVDANRFIQGKSVQWVIDWTARKMGGGQQRAAAQHPGRLQKGGGGQAAGSVVQPTAPVSRETRYAEYMRWIDENISNPVQREAVRRRFNERKGWDEKGEQEARENSTRMAQDFIASGGSPDRLPAAIQQALGPSGMQAMRDYQFRLEKGQQEQMEYRSRPIYFDYLYRPEQLDGMSEQQIMNLSPVIGLDKANDLLNRKRQREKEGEHSAPNVESAMVKQAMRLYGIPMGDNASQEDIQKRYWFQDNVRVANQNFYRVHGRYMTDGEMWQFITTTFGDKYVNEYVSQGVFWNSTVREEVPALLSSEQQRNRMRYERGSK